MAGKEAQWKIEWVDPKSLKPHPDNYNKHPEEQLQDLDASINEFGVYQAIIISSDGHVLCHEGVTTGALRTAQDKVPVRRMDFPHDDPRALKLMVLDNTSARRNEPDEDALSQLLCSIQAESGLQGTGHDDDSLQELLQQVNDANPPTGYVEEDEGPGEPPEEPVTRAGDVWVCGKSRVICGDCTDPLVVQKVTQGKRVPTILTDPPYQMAKDIANDSLSDADFSELHKDFVAMLPAADVCTFVGFHSTRTFPVLLDAAREAGWKFERYMTMYKPNDCTFPWRGWLLKSEAILIFTQSGGAWAEVHPFAHDTYEHNHGAAQKEDRGGHPACKPLPVVVDILSRLGGSEVFDPFLGSGTTLVAAESLGRICYACELEPRWTDVCILRWQKATGKQATLEATGETFDALRQQQRQ